MFTCIVGINNIHIKNAYKNVHTYGATQVFIFIVATKNVYMYSGYRNFHMYSSYKNVRMSSGYKKFHIYSGYKHDHIYSGFKTRKRVANGVIVKRKARRSRLGKLHICIGQK